MLSYFNSNSKYLKYHSCSIILEIYFFMLQYSFYSDESHTDLNQNAVNIVDCTDTWLQQRSLGKLNYFFSNLSDFSKREIRFLQTH